MTFARVKGTLATMTGRSIPIAVCSLKIKIFAGIL